MARTKRCEASATRMPSRRTRPPLRSAAAVSCFQSSASAGWANIGDESGRLRSASQTLAR